MSVESAADRATFFDEDEFATAAQYLAPEGGVPLDCSVIYDRERRDPLEVAGDSGSGMRKVRTWQGAQLLADQVPVVMQGGRITLGTRIDEVFVGGGVVLEVIGRPKLDESGAIWDVDLRTVS